MDGILFWTLGGLLLAFSVSVVASRNPVHCAGSMIAAFLVTAALYVTLDAYLIAILQVLVYAGAVMVLFLFVIMLLDLRAGETRRVGWAPLGIAGAVAVLAAIAVRGIGPALGLAPASLADGIEGTTEALASTLFTDYVVPFEIVSVLLLGAILGAVVLAAREDEAS